VPSYGDFGRQVAPLVAADAYRLTAPETEAEALSPRSDVYALGAMLYCLLTGQSPPEPDLLASRQEKLVPPSRINRALARNLEKIVLKAMQLDPKRRYPTAAEMAQDLEAFLMPRLLEPEKTEKPSLLMRLAPFMVAVTLLLCLAVVIEGLPRLKEGVDLSWLFGLRAWSTPESEAQSIDIDLTFPAPAATATPVVTLTIIPATEVRVHQIRLAQYPEVIVYGSVLDAEQEPIPDLGRDLFWLSQDGANIPTLFVEDASLAQEALAVVVAVDTSRSMEGERLQTARLAIADFVLGLGVEDQVSLVSFDNQVELVRDFTVNKMVIAEGLDSLQPGGATAMFDAIAFSAERLSAWPGRRAILLLTDGRDTASADYDLDGALAAANGSNTPVFIVDLNKNQFDPQFMVRIPADTGGTYYWAPELENLLLPFQKVRRQLQVYYRFQFTSQHLVDGSMHRIAIGFERGDGARVWGEKKYRSK
jgi:VWFA-related protein